MEGAPAALDFGTLEQIDPALEQDRPEQHIPLHELAGDDARGARGIAQQGERDLLDGPVACREQDVTVIEPGVPAHWTHKRYYAATARQLLCLSNYVPGKGHVLVMQVLQELVDLPWILQFNGNRNLDPACYEVLVSEVETRGLQDRVSVGGAVTHDQVQHLMCSADLLLQFSESESYSIVTAEAIACGLPVLSTRTGDWRNFAQSGLVSQMANPTPGSSARALREMIEDASCYGQLRPDANRSRRTWEDAGRQFLDWMRQPA